MPVLVVSGSLPRDAPTHAEVAKTCGALQEAYEEDPEYAVQRRSGRRHREAPVRRTRTAPVSVSVSVRFFKVRAPADAPAHPPATDGCHTVPSAACRLCMLPCASHTPESTRHASSV